MRYIMGILLALGLIVLIFVLIFRGGSNKPATPQIDLNSYANTTATVQLTVDGRVTANQTHQSYKIIVGRDQTSMQVMSGYENNVQNTKTYANNQLAFATFLRSLSLVGFTKVDQEGPKDERGYCPSGQRYIYELINNGRDVVRSWSTSCGGLGTYKGDVGNTRILFQKQIPDYDVLLRGVIL